MKKIASLYLDAYKGLNPSAWWLSLVMLINRMGAMVMPFMTLYLTQSKDVSIAKAGIVLAVFGLGTVAGGFLGGKLTDKFGFYFVQLFALMGGGLMFILLGQMESFTSICITSFFLSMINESFRPANAAAIAHYSKKENVTRSFTLNRLAMNLGWAVGGALGGFIAAQSYHLLFWIDGFTNVLAGVLLWIVLAPSKNKGAEEDAVKEPIKKSAYKDTPFLMFVLFNTFYACCFFQIFTTIPVYFKQDLSLREGDIGILMSINGILIAFFEMVIIKMLEGRKALLTYIIIGAALIGLGFMILNIIPGTFSVALIYILLISIGEIVGLPFMATFWIQRTTNRNRGQYAGLYTMSWAIAQIVGPATGAWVADTYNFNTLWWGVTLFFLIAVLGFRWIQNREQKAELVAASTE
ncbi:MAG: MFS transporter [Flavipsychrobacter sp.]